MTRKSALSAIFGFALFAITGVSPSTAAPLTIGYSD